MDYQIGKPFDRLGQRYRTGDAPPPDLDKATVQHYLRHGMLTDAAPVEPTEPVRTPAPKTARHAAPQEAQAPTRAPEVN